MLGPSGPDTVVLTWNEALSGATGSISLAAWIFLLVPQLVENYQQSSADGISLAFLLVWFAGDVTNLAGALWARLVPTVTALAVYFCIMDTVLIAQCVYYRVRNGKERKGKRRSTVGSGVDVAAGLNGEVEPLLGGGVMERHSSNNSNGTLVGGRRRSSELARQRHADRRESLASIVEEGRGNGAWIKNGLSIIFVCAAGAAGWALAWSSGVWQPIPTGNDGDVPVETPLGAEILGYTSAVCYLSARIPQIVKNQRERSCEGLSLLFFLLSLLGNASYGAGILFHSIEREYVLTNLPWLIGSLGTMAEDAIIFAQFHAFGDRSKATAVQDT